MSVFPHSDGKRWIAAVQYKTHDGKRRSRSQFAESKRKAEQLEREFLRQRDAKELPGMTAPKPMTPGMPTLSSYIETYLTERRKPGRKQIRASSERRYRDALKHAAPLSSVPLDQIDGRMIDACFDDARDAGLEESTVFVTFKALRAVLRAAASGRHPLIGFNPIVECHPPAQTSTRETVILDTGDIDKLVAAADAYDATYEARYGALVRVLAWTGMRLGEALALDWTAVDFDRNRIHVRRAMNKLGEIGETKTKTSRYVAISAATIAVLRGVLEGQLLDRMHAPSSRDGKSAYQDAGFVFCNRLGEPLTQSGVENVWQRVRKAAGIRSRLNDLRHAHASHLLRAGTPLATVSKRLGHSNVAITLSTYTHALPSDDDLAAGMVDAVFGGG